MNLSRLRTESICLAWPVVIVTKVGARRGVDKSWIHALSRQELIHAIHDNLQDLGLVRPVEFITARIFEAVMQPPSPGDILDVSRRVRASVQREGRR